MFIKEYWSIRYQLQLESDKSNMKEYHSYLHEYEAMSVNPLIVFVYVHNMLIIVMHFRCVSLIHNI